MQYVTTDPISLKKLTDDLSYLDCGAMTSFTGMVRNHHKGKAVTKLIYEAYKPMAEKVMLKIKQEVELQFTDCKIAMIHRIGELKIGDTAIVIAAWAPHRGEAFTACELLINRIKQEVPIWKQEFYQDGENDWVECCHQSH
jgi:molybdopterin synthase catalytic subunit